MPSLEFTMPGTIAVAFAASLSLPVYLGIIARVSFFAGRNALQFLISVVLTTAVWIIALRFVPSTRPAEIVVGGMVLASAVLVYLQIWAMLSRGYTLSMLMTLFQAGRPLSAAEIASRYRGGESLEWVMHHRLAGLQAAQLVCRDGPRLVLTPKFGRVVAWSYRAAIVLLGLKATG